MKVGKLGKSFLGNNPLQFTVVYKVKYLRRSSPFSRYNCTRLMNIVNRETIVPYERKGTRNILRNNIYSLKFITMLR